MANAQVDKCFTALMDAADALETVAGKVAEAACQLHTLFDWDQQIPETEVAPVVEAAAEVAVEQASNGAPEPELEPLSFEQLRAVLTEKSRGGYTDQIRQLLPQYGVNKISDLDPAHYPALLAAVESLGVES